jgi:DNA-binding MarR family transcriptional regulator
MQVPEPDDVGLLLVQLGSHVARQFAEQLRPLGLEPRQAGMLIRLAANEGRSQQAVADLIGLNPTQMVFLVDELEQRGLVRRQRNPADRRSYALSLTEQGREKLAEIGKAGRENPARIGSSLGAADRRQLAALLQRLAAEQGLAEQGMPGAPPGS